HRRPGRRAASADRLQIRRGAVLARGPNRRGVVRHSVGESATIGGQPVSAFGPPMAALRCPWYESANPPRTLAAPDLSATADDPDYKRAVLSESARKVAGQRTMHYITSTTGQPC